MQCKCGASTVERTSVRKDVGKIEWPECAVCSRVGRPMVFRPDDGAPAVVSWRRIDWAEGGDIVLR